MSPVRESKTTRPGGIRALLRRSCWFLAFAVAAIVVHDLVTQPSRPDYAVVRSVTALDDWNAAAISAPGRTACGEAPDRWIVVGWDGASWDLVLPLIEQGRLPNLAGLMADGTAAALAGFRPSLSPVLWTTVATGVTPDRHGILGFDKRRHRLLRRLERVARLGGLRRELYSNADRRVPALWNLASDEGLEVLVVGYHNTYPAEEVRGAMVSNYLVQAYVKQIMRANRDLPEEFRNSLVFPPESAEEILAIEQRLEAEVDAAAERFAAFDHRQRSRFPKASRSLGDDGDHRMYFLRQAWLWDTFHGETTLALHPQVRPRLTLVHFQGIDLTSHYFLSFHRPDWYDEMGWSAEERADQARQRETYADTVPAFYEYLDEWLGRLLELRDERTGVLVLSDHGVEAENDPDRGGHHDSAPPGILVAAGPGIRRGATIDDATLFDIMPTLTRTLGLPLARDLPGRVLDELFCHQALSSTPLLEVDEYAAPDWAPAIATPPVLVEEIERELRSLGYLD